MCSQQCHASLFAFLFSSSQCKWKAIFPCHSFLRYGKRRHPVICSVIHSVTTFNCQWPYPTPKRISLLVCAHLCPECIHWFDVFVVQVIDSLPLCICRCVLNVLASPLDLENTGAVRPYLLDTVFLESTTVAAAVIKTVTDSLWDRLWEHCLQHR